MPRRPKSDGRCVHCREGLVDKTKDHVFPGSWYPDSTGPEVQRWTVPSCRRCNEEFGEKEKELFVRLALCIDPRKHAAAGISTQASRSFGAGVIGLDPKEKHIREALRDKIFREIKPYTKSVEGHVLPGLGLHPGFPAEQQMQVSIPADLLYAVAKKIVRGCEYWLANGRIIDPPYEIEALFVRDVPEDIRRAFGPFGPVSLGPGFRIRRAGVVDDLGVAMYEIVIWDTITIFYAILPPETAMPVTTP